MPKKKKYTMSDKVLAFKTRQTNWEKRLEVLRLKNQGWTVKQIAEKYSTSHQAVSELIRKMKHMSVIEAEQMATKIQRSLE